MAITQEEISLIRSRGQRSKVSLSIFRPTTVLKCRINDASIARGEMTITYDSVTEGDWTGVEAGMTLLVGTTEDGEERGRIRIKSITASEIEVAENSNILWEDNLYLTVLRYWEILPVYPRIILDPADPEDTLWYKDYDIAYTNQNTALGAIPCAGSHRAAYLDDGSVDIFYTATGTSQVAGAAFSTDWWFEGGTVTGSSDYTPGNITYDTPGHYVTRLIVSGTNFYETTYRYVSIYDKPDEGTDVPILQWEVSSIDGNRAGGGYSANFKVFEDIVINEGDVVVLFGESWFGNTKQTIGGNALGGSDIFFVGHVLKGSIEYNYKYGEVTFSVGSVTQYLKEQEGFSISVESVVSPVDWYQLYDLNIERALYHYLKWHTTVLSTTDVQFLGTDRPLQYFDSDRQSIYDAINGLLKGTILGQVTSDMQGKIWAEQGAKAFPEDYSTPEMEITKKDWINSPTIEERLLPAISYLEYGGIAYSGVATGSYEPFMSNAPGSAPLYRGSSERQQGLAPVSQEELNQMSGHMLANKNSKYPRISYDMVESLRNIDLAPQRSYTLLVEADDTPRNIEISGTYLPESITWNYNSKDQMFYPRNMSFESLVTGSAGQTIPIPIIPDDTGYSSPAYNAAPIPTISYPAIPGGTTVYTAALSLLADSYVWNTGDDINVLWQNNPISGNTTDNYTTYFEFPVSGNYRKVKFLKKGIYIITAQLNIAGMTAGNRFGFDFSTLSTSADSGGLTDSAGDGSTFMAHAFPFYSTILNSYTFDASIIYPEDGMTVDGGQVSFVYIGDQI